MRDAVVRRVPSKRSQAQTRSQKKPKRSPPSPGSDAAQGNSTRTPPPRRRSVAPRQQYSPPSGSRSDAAQMQGAKTPKPKPRVYSPPPFRSDAAQKKGAKTPPFKKAKRRPIAPCPVSIEISESRRKWLIRLAESRRIKAQYEAEERAAQKEIDKGASGFWGNFASGGLDLVPVVGWGKGVVEAIDGRDLVTRKKLALWERGLGAIPGGKYVKRGAEGVGAVKRVIRGGGNKAGEKAVKNPANFTSPSNAKGYEDYKKHLRREMEKPSVKDPKLKEKVDNIYRETAEIGSGSTAAAIRHTRQTGELVKGSDHIEKGEGYIINLKKWLKNNPDAQPGDKAAAENMIKDLEDALYN